MTTITSVQYHRNGVAGEGFFVVRFRAPDIGEGVGVLFPAWTDEDAIDLSRCDHTMRTAVLSLDNPDRCWRGDHFHADLWRAVWRDQAQSDGTFAATLMAQGDDRAVYWATSAARYGLGVLTGKLPVWRDV